MQGNETSKEGPLRSGFNRHPQQASSASGSLLTNPQDEVCPVNKTMFQGFEWYCPPDHKHWVRLRQLVPTLSMLGVTSMWIPPATKAAWEKSNGYDIYDLYDLGEFPQKKSKHTKWGTKAELIALCDTAQEHGIDILFDAVLNHKAAADRTEVVNATRVQPLDRTVAAGKPETIEAWTAFDFKGRQGAYSPMKWNKDHFTGTDWCNMSRSKGLWKFEGKTWSEFVDEELGNYDYLMFADVDHSHPEVCHDLFYWVQWLASQIKLGGLRLDAVKHYSAEFLRSFILHVDKTVGKEWFIVGEYWRQDSDVLARYIEYMQHRISLFDVRLVSNFSRLSLLSNADLRTVFDGALVPCKPNNAVTFVANHDTQEGQSLETPVAPFFVPLAYALILLRANAGLPCVFYGHLYGCVGPITQTDGSPCIPPTSGGQLLPKLMLARKFYAYGPQVDYFDDSDCIAFTRLGHPSHARGAGLAVIMTNGWVANAKRMCVGKRHAGEHWTDVLRGCFGAVSIDEEGWGLFPVGPRSVAVWVNKKAQGRDMIDGLFFDIDVYGHVAVPEVVSDPHVQLPGPAWLMGMPRGPPN